MDVRKLRYALAVARERSFTNAAKQVSISQSSISEQVKQLEAIVGFEIFTRASNGVEPTDRGRTFLREAERIYGELIGLSDIAKVLQGEGETFAVAIASGLAPILVPNYLSKFSMQYPHVRLEITTASTRRIFDELNEQKIDAGIAIESDTRRTPAGLHQIKFLETEMVLLVPENHKLGRLKSTVSIEKLAQSPIIMNELDFGYGEVVRTLFENSGLRPNAVSISDNIDTMKCMVESGMGVAIVPKVCIESDQCSRQYKVKNLSPVRNFSFSLMRRRAPMAKRKEMQFDFLLTRLTA